MSRFAIMSLLSTTVIAAAVSCAASIASCAPSMPDPVNGKVGCTATGSPSAAGLTGAPLAPCAPQMRTAEQDDRAYLLETSSPGATMVRQGPEVAIARLNPEFVARLAGAIREARQSGLPTAGISSAYRPPAYGIGGFADKFMSLHAYGLAVDMSGIGDPGSQDAKLWHEIAARHGVICPYAFDNRAEWNHCAATALHEVLPDHPLRKTITAQGPIALDEMFVAGNAVIVDLPQSISVAQTMNERRGSIAVRVAAVSRSEQAGRWHSPQGRHRFVVALSHAARSPKGTAIVLARNEARLAEKTRNHHNQAVLNNKAHRKRA